VVKLEDNIIAVYKSSRGVVKVASWAPLFLNNERLEVIVASDRTIIKEPTIDYSGKLYSVVNPPNKSPIIHIVAEIPLGHYPIDNEESEECLLVFYFEDKIVE